MNSNDSDRFAASAGRKAYVGRLPGNGSITTGANICLAVPLTLMAMTCTNLGNVGFQVFPGEYESVHIFLCTNKI